MNNLPKLIGKGMVTKTTFVMWVADTIHFEVKITFPDSRESVMFPVPMPDRAVITHLSRINPAFIPSLPKETAEFYIQNYQVREVEAFAYALATFDTLPSPLKFFLNVRFGDKLSEALKLGKEWWKNVAMMADSPNG